MTNSNHHIDRSVYRVLLSEVLPYELPFFFSFKDFYYFADRARFTIDSDGNIKCKAHQLQHEEWFKTLISMLNASKEHHRSFKYDINKDGKEVRRTLVLVHPYVALEIVQFYRDYAGFMVNSCSRSSYTLRHPTRIAHKRKNLQGASSLKEITDEDVIELPRNYFFYEPIKNINRFYEGGLLERLECRFEHMYVSDMKHCFDNIPAHRFAEAVYVTDRATLTPSTFPIKAVNIMKEMTNGNKGVAIGPEFSRVFAEIVLQRIDSEIEKKMEDKGLIQQKDYVCLRYVDDCFFLYNEDKVKNEFIRIQNTVLASWSLSLNKDKKEVVTLPYITPITRAKDQVTAMIVEMFEFRLDTAKGLVHISEGIYDTPLKMSSHNCIKVIKSIMAGKGVEISKITSFLLSQLQKKLLKSLDSLDSLLSEYQEANKEHLLDKEGTSILRKYEGGTVRFLCELTEFLFFIFRVDTRMSSSIRIVSILDIIIRYTENKLFKDSDAAFFNSNRSELYKTVHDELILILRNNKLGAYNGLEICNLLSIMTDLPDNFAISNNIMLDFIGEAFDTPDSDVNFLMAFAILKSLKESSIADVNGVILNKITDWLLSRLEKKNWDIGDAECFYIISGIMPLKSIKGNKKTAITQHFKDFDLKKLESTHSPFMQWKGASLRKACDEKFAVDVY